MENCVRVDPPEAHPDDVLAQATRARLFALIGDLGRPAGTDELAERLGLHPNGIRIHLDRLLAAGLVVRRRAPQPRGRPRDEWSVSPEAEPGGAPPRAYGDLARWLARAIPARPSRLRDVERAGREIGPGDSPGQRRLGGGGRCTTPSPASASSPSWSETPTAA